MKKDEKKENTVTLLIVCKDGKRIIEIPDTWKITYGMSDKYPERLLENWQAANRKRRAA